MIDNLHTGQTFTFPHTGKDDATIVIETATGTMTEGIDTDATGLRLPEDETPRTGIVDHLTEVPQDGVWLNFVQRAAFNSLVADILLLDEVCSLKFL